MIFNLSEELSCGTKWCDYSFHDFSLSSIYFALEAEIDLPKPHFLAAIFFELRTANDGQLTFHHVNVYANGDCWRCPEQFIFLFSLIEMSLLQEVNGWRCTIATDSSPMETILRRNLSVWGGTEDRTGSPSVNSMIKCLIMFTWRNYLNRKERNETGKRMMFSRIHLFNLYPSMWMLMSCWCQTIEKKKSFGTLMESVQTCHSFFFIRQNTIGIATSSDNQSLFFY